MTLKDAEIAGVADRQALDEWIEEHRREIDECPATVAGYRRAVSLRWGLERLLEYRAHLERTQGEDTGDAR